MECLFGQCAEDFSYIGSFDPPDNSVSIEIFDILMIKKLTLSDFSKFQTVSLTHIYDAP